MLEPFSPRLDRLPPPQRRLWPELAEVPPEFILYGGTAIALQLGHRRSVDFDFFGSKRFAVEALHRRIPFLDGAELVQSEASTATYRVDRGGGVLVSFFGVPGLGRIDEPVQARDNGLRVASLRDLAGTKVSVVQLRSEAKDYIDVAALLAHGIDLPTAIAAAMEIYGLQFNPQNALKALVYFQDGDLPALPAKTRRLLEAAVRAVDLDALPRIDAVRKRPRRGRRRA